jgi:hypothetical protein
MCLMESLMARYKKSEDNEKLYVWRDLSTMYSTANCDGLVANF